MPIPVFKYIALIVLMLALAACTQNLAKFSGEYAPPVTVASIADKKSRLGRIRFNVVSDLKVIDKSHVEVKLLYGTNRNLIASNRYGKTYGGNRNGMFGKVHYGVSVVNIPISHKLGKLETPGYISSFIFSPRKDKHVFVKENIVLKEAEFHTIIQSLNERTDTKKGLLFVHGYNSTFQDAARRSAQLAYDLKYQGVPMFYSWPSAGKELLYFKDDSNIEWSAPHFLKFLTDLFDEHEFDNFTLIAHSMGNRLVVNTLSELAKTRKDLAGKINVLIMAAPDVEDASFRRDHAHLVTKMAKQVTVYASNGDKPLWLSGATNGYKRLGDARGGLMPIDGIDMIDGSGFDTGFLGHSDFGDRDELLADMFETIRHSSRPRDRFNLVQLSNTGRSIWRVRN